MTTSSLSTLYAARGLALCAAPEGQGVELPHDHGDAAAERRMASEGAALFDATARGLVVASGAEARDLLQRMLAGEVLALESGALSENLLLTPKGRVRFAFTLLRDDDDLRLVTAAGDAAPLAAALDGFVFAEDVQLEDVSSSSAALELIGPKAEAVLTTLLGEAPDVAFEHWRELSWRDQPLRLEHARVLGVEGWRLDAGPQRAGELWTALSEAGATPAGLAAREALRVANRSALTGVELVRDEDEAPYPQEALLEHAFSLAKGCYVGQEVVAKLDTYGGLNRRLTAFSVQAVQPVAPGTPLVTAGGEEAGKVTTWCEALGRETPSVLAFLKLRQEQAAPFTAGANGPELEPLA